VREKLAVGATGLPAAFRDDAESSESLEGDAPSGNEKSKSWARGDEAGAPWIRRPSLLYVWLALLVVLVGGGGCERGELCRKWAGMAGTGVVDSVRAIRPDRRRSTFKSAMSRSPTVLRRARGV
jgi:hypothetical protein